MVANAIVACPQCRAPFPPETYNTGQLSPCGQCGALTQINAFPALLKPDAVGSAPESPAGDEEAGCYYHPTKKAVVPCDHCGRFLCRLCDLALHAQHLCPHCLDGGKDKNNIDDVNKGRTLHDSIALSLSIMPLLFFPLTLFTAPVALYIAARHFRTPLSLVPRKRWRYVPAIILSLLQIGGWIVFFTWLATN